MTAIEFYDRTPIENVISALTVVPKKIIFIGENSQMDDFEGIYKRFLAGRHLEIEVDYRGINRHDVNGIARKLSEIVEQEEECLFDLTGGDDLVLVAMGMVYQKYKDVKNIQMQRFNVQSGRVTDCDNDGNPVYEGTPALSVRELVQLHGGAVRYGTVEEGYTYRWALTEPFTADVERMWNVCRADPRRWNVCMTAISEAGTELKGSTAVSTSLPWVESYLKQNELALSVLFDLLHTLESEGLISDLCTDGRTLSYVCKDMQVKRCLDKAGTVLEMMVLVAAKRVTDKDGTPFYCDVANGVFIDWDGAFHSRDDLVKDTNNEIDAVLMRGLAPVFISCKNGGVEDDELYKLDAVADRFGGEYVRKVLVATYLNKSEDSLRHFRQRAKDMKIKLVEGVYLLEPAGFEDMLRRLVMGE